VLLKGQKLCDDFGVGRTNVRNFIDSAFSNSHIILPSALEEKITSLAIRERPLEIVYFGRLVSYKGIDQSIRAFAKVIANYGLKLRFHIIGAGPEEGCLRELTTSLGLVEYVVFHAPISFGPELFAYLQNNCDLLLATPQSEDTPRSALDAMASGIPILAFDTYYYRDLQPSGAVEVGPWNSLEKLAQKILEYAEDKTLLENASRHAVRFAQENTQEIWLRRRYNWTLEALEKLR
jgi:glycosyltransferase involved in cell wall biosynthesis